MIEEIASLDHLNEALRHCRQGKRASMGYQKFLLQMPSSISEIHEELLAGTYRWLPYRTFTVCDPKSRLILAAPFRDRIVHQAICQVLAPTLDALIPHNSFACRKGMGNHAAALSLADILKKLGPDRWTIKLDVRQYFLSIDHKTLMTMLGPYVETPEVTALVRSLLASYPEYGKMERGLPIGNVSSQSFANLYLSPVDRLGASIDGVDYIRYTDDMVITGHHRKAEYSLAAAIRAMVHETLKLSIPYHKIIEILTLRAELCQKSQVLGFPVRSSLRGR